MISPNDRSIPGLSIPGLLSEALNQFAKLIGNEFDLARAEISEKANQAVRAATLIGAGAIMFIPALVLVLFAIASALIRQGFSDPVAYLITGVGTAVLAIALVAYGLRRLSGDALKPSITLNQIQQDKIAAKEMVR
jgi:hypothetical protein